MAQLVSPTLLPPPLARDLAQRALETLGARVEQLDLQTLLVYDFDHVAASALPGLGEQFGLLGDAGWDFAGFGPAPEAKKRALLKEAVALHRKRGTRFAVERALELVGIRSKIIEWWEMSPPGAPYTFKVQLYLTDAPAGQPLLTPEKAEAVLNMVRYWKPASRAFVAQVGVGFTARTRTACVLRPAQPTPVRMRPVTQMSATLRTRSATVLRPAQRVSLMLLPVRP